MLKIINCICINTKKLAKSIDSRLLKDYTIKESRNKQQLIARFK